MLQTFDKTHNFAILFELKSISANKIVAFQIK